MHSRQTLWLLKGMMVSGLALLVLGHYLWSGLKLQETMGVQGIILIGACCALGLILSLPTKIYLTILLMQREAETASSAAAIARSAGPAGPGAPAEDQSAAAAANSDSSCAAASGALIRHWA